VSDYLTVSALCCTSVNRLGGPGLAFETWLFAGLDLIPGRDGTPHGFERRVSGSSLASNALSRLTQPLPAPLPHRSSIGNWTISHCSIVSTSRRLTGFQCVYSSFSTRLPSVNALKLQ
jgi:hypothetical protein